LKTERSFIIRWMKKRLGWDGQKHLMLLCQNLTLYFNGFGSIISCVSRVVSTDFSSWHSTKVALSQTSPSLRTQVVFFKGTLSWDFFQIPSRVPCQKNYELIWNYHYSSKQMVNTQLRLQICNLYSINWITWILFSVKQHFVKNCVITSVEFAPSTPPSPSPFHTESRMTKREEREIAAVAVLTDRGLWEEPTPPLPKAWSSYFFCSSIFPMY
jgi:hypothetical protein